jgi:Zn ribbon nucleic-acid-binding protein
MNSRSVCPQCIEEPSLAAYIKANASVEHCSFCGKE